LQMFYQKHILAARRLLKIIKTSGFRYANQHIMI